MLGVVILIADVVFVGIRTVVMVGVFVTAADVFVGLKASSFVSQFVGIRFKRSLDLFLSRHGSL